MGIRGHSRASGDPSRARDGNARTAGAVLIVHPSLDLYGSDRVVLDTAASLESHGYSVVLVLPGNGPLSDEARRRGLTTICLPFPAIRKGYLSPRGLARLGGELVACAPRIVRLLRSKQWDAVVVNTVIAPWWVVAARATGVPVVCHVHEAETDLSLSARRVILAPLLLADVVIANSRATAAFVDGTWTRLRDRTRIVYNGVSPPSVVARTRAPVPGPASLHVLLVGRLNPRKGGEAALEAVSRLRQEGADVTLTFAGSVFPGYEWFEMRLRQRREALGLEGAVNFAGFVSDTGPFYDRADVVAMPSTVESLGNVALEAAAWSRPVVASAVGGLMEAVVDGQTGILVPSGDIDALTSALRRLAHDRDLREALGHNGAERVRREFSPAQYASGIVAAVSAATDLSSRKGLRAFLARRPGVSHI